MEAPVTASRWSERGPGRDLLQIVLFATLVRFFVGLFLGLRIQGSRRLPTHGPLVVVANHNSHLDTLALLSLFPLGALRRVHPAAAADYFMRSRSMAWISRTFFNILPIERKGEHTGPDPIEQMIAVLDRGEILLVFPEGTRGDGEQLTRFRSGAGRVLVSRPEVEVVTIGMRNTGRSLPKGRAFPVPFFVDIAIDPPHLPTGDAHAITAALEERVLKLIEAASPASSGAGSGDSAPM